MLRCVICHRLLKQTLRPASEEMDYCGATCAPASLPSCAMGSALKPPANLYIDAAGTAWTSNACPCGSGTEIRSGDSSVSSGVSVSTLRTANNASNRVSIVCCRTVSTIASMSGVGAGAGVGIAPNVSRTAVSTIASTSGVGADGGGVSAAVDAPSSLVQAAAITAPNSKMSMNPLRPLRPVHNWC